jgi:hypothetical protein
MTVGYAALWPFAAFALWPSDRKPYGPGDYPAGFGAALYRLPIEILGRPSAVCSLVHRQRVRNSSECDIASNAIQEIP